MTYADGSVEAGWWANGDYFETKEEQEAHLKKEKDKLLERLAEESVKAAEEKARKKRSRIYNACLLDKSSGVDMQVSSLKKAVEDTCAAIAADPSWYQEWKYD